MRSRNPINPLPKALYSTIIHRLLLYWHVKNLKMCYMNLEIITKIYHQMITKLVTGLDWGVTNMYECLHICHLATSQGKLMVYLPKWLPFGRKDPSKLIWYTDMYILYCIILSYYIIVLYYYYITLYFMICYIILYNIQPYDIQTCIPRLHLGRIASKRVGA